MSDITAIIILIGIVVLFTAFVVFACTAVYKDAVKQGIFPTPWVFITALTCGSGALFYLVYRYMRKEQ